MSNSVPSWCRVGAKVVCVNPNPLWNEWVAVQSPKKCGVYTIRAVVDGDALLLEELRNRLVLVEANDGLMDIGEPRFGWWRFRPLVNDQTEAKLYRKRGLGTSKTRENEAA